MDEPQAEQLVETLDHCGVHCGVIVERPGQPVALIPRKRGISCVRASVLPSLKNRDTLRAALSCTGGKALT